VTSPLLKKIGHLPLTFTKTYIPIQILLNERRVIMESRNLIIAFVWIFVLIISIILFWIGESYVAGIGGPFVASAALFIIALIVSVVMLPRTRQ